MHASILLEQTDRKNKQPDKSYNIKKILKCYKENQSKVAEGGVAESNGGREAPGFDGRSGKPSSVKWNLRCEDKMSLDVESRTGLAHIHSSGNVSLELPQLPKVQKPPITLHCVPWESLTAHLLLLLPPGSTIPAPLENALPSDPTWLGLPRPYCSLLSLRTSCCL